MHKVDASRIHWREIGTSIAIPKDGMTYHSSVSRDRDITKRQCVLPSLLLVGVLSGNNHCYLIQHLLLTLELKNLVTGFLILRPSRRKRNSFSCNPLIEAECNNYSDAEMSKVRRDCLQRLPFWVWPVPSLFIVWRPWAGVDLNRSVLALIILPAHITLTPFDQLKSAYL